MNCIKFSYYIALLATTVINLQNISAYTISMRNSSSEPIRMDIEQSGGSGCGFYEDLPAGTTDNPAVNEQARTGNCVGACYGRVTVHALVPEQFANIAVGPNGEVWGVTYSQKLFRLNKSTWNWDKMPGTFMQVANGSHGSSDDVWAVDTSKTVVKWNAGDNHWQNMTSAIGGKLIYISVGSDGTTWGIGTEGEAWILGNNRRNNEWKHAGSAQKIRQLAVVNIRTIFALDKQGNVYSWSWNDKNWDPIPMHSIRLQNIAVGNDQKLWGVDTTGKVYFYKNNAWQEQPELGELRALANVYGKSIWAIDKDGNATFFYDKQKKRTINSPGNTIREPELATEEIPTANHCTNLYLTWDGTNINIEGAFGNVVKKTILIGKTLGAGAKNLFNLVGEGGKCKDATAECFAGFDNDQKSCGTVQVDRNFGLTTGCDVPADQLTTKCNTLCMTQFKQASSKQTVTVNDGNVWDIINDAVTHAGGCQPLTVQCCAARDEFAQQCGTVTITQHKEAGGCVPEYDKVDDLCKKQCQKEFPHLSADIPSHICTTKDLEPQPIYYAYTIKNNYSYTPRGTNTKIPTPIDVTFTITKKSKTDSCGSRTPEGSHTITIQPGKEFSYGDGLGSTCPITKIDFKTTVGALGGFTQLSASQITSFTKDYDVKEYDPNNEKYLADINKKTEQGTVSLVTFDVTNQKNSTDPYVTATTSLIS